MLIMKCFYIFHNVLDSPLLQVLNPSQLAAQLLQMTHNNQVLLPQCFHLYSIIIRLLMDVFKVTVADLLYGGKG